MTDDPTNLTADKLGAAIRSVYKKLPPLYYATADEVPQGRVIRVDTGGLISTYFVIHPDDLPAFRLKAEMNMWRLVHLADT